MTKEEHDSQTRDSDQSATGAVNSGKGDAPISLDDSTVESLLSHPLFEAKVNAVAEAKAQGQKDRRIARLENELGDLLGQLNLTEEQKARYKEIERDQMITQLYEAYQKGEGPGPVETQPPASGGVATTVDVIGSFQAVGYDPNTITLEDYEFASQFKTDAELKNALLKKRLESEQADIQSASDGAVIPQTGPPPARDSQAKLMKDYKERLAQIRPGNADAIAQLKVEFQKKGLKNIY